MGCGGGGIDEIMDFLRPAAKDEEIRNPASRGTNGKSAKEVGLADS